MAEPHKLPSGAWRGVVYVETTKEGKIVRKSVTAPTKSECYRRMDEVKEALKAKKPGKTDVPTIAEAIEKYIEVKRPVLSPTTIRGYIAMSGNPLITEIGDVPLKDIDRDFLQGFINRLISSGASTKYVKNAYYFITAVVRYNAPDIGIPKVDIPKRSQPRGHAMSDTEIGLFLLNLKGTRYELPLILALCLGLRRSEICALRPSDFYPEYKSIHVTRAYIYGEDGLQEKDYPKNTSSVRWVHLFPYAFDLMKRETEKIDDDRRIVDVAPNTLTEVVPRLCEQWGMKRYTLHDLRRSMATAGVREGVPDKIMQARGGWADNATMKAIYQQALAEDIAQTEQKLDSYFQSFYSE